MPKISLHAAQANKNSWNFILINNCQPHHLSPLGSADGRTESFQQCLVSRLLKPRSLRKYLSNWGMLATACCLMVAKLSATSITNVSWTFPTNSISGTSEPVGPGLSTYSTDDYLAWIKANNRLTVNFVPNLGEGTALEFSYNGNHSEFLNGSVLTLTSTVSAPADYSFTHIQFSYHTRWSLSGSSITETWAYSLNGGAFKNLETDVAAGDGWHTEGSFLDGLTLTDGETITFRDTISGATGNNGNLEFDNIQISSTIVPEPSAPVLASLGGFAALIAFQRKRL